MRVKSRGSLDQTPQFGAYSHHRVVDGALVGGPYRVDFGPSNRGKLESIAYDDSKRSSRQPRTTRFCDHQKVETDGHRITEQHKLAPGFTTYSKTDLWMGSHDVSELVLPDLAPYCTEAMQFFKAGCQDQKLDLALNFLEIDQVKSLLPGLKRTLHSLWLHFYVESTKWTLKSAADLHLATSFGVMPLISDISGIVSAVKSLHDRVAWLRKNHGKLVRVDFRKDLSTLNAPATVRYVDSVNESLTNVVRHYRCFFHAFATVTYDVSQLSDMELRLRLLTRAFGMDKPLNTIWDHIPYSFVVDWIFSVGRVIDSFTPAISLPVRFHDLGHSIKIQRTDENILERKYPYGPSGGSCVTTRTRYVRWPGLPVSFSSLSENDLSLRQLALSMSLALQKWR